MDIDQAITSVTESIEKQLKAGVKNISEEVFKGCKEKTPVLTGRAKASWTIKEDVPSLAVAPAMSNTSVSNGKIKVAKPFTQVFVDNALQYVVDIELGTDRVAPRAMVSTTLEEIRNKYT